jgi:DNA polymerase III delta subunit
MVIFLYGEDSFRRKRKYAEIVSEFIAKNGNLGFSDFDSGETDKFLEAVKNRSIFSPRTLIGIKDADLDNLPESTLSAFKSTLSRIADSKETIVLVSSIGRELPEGMAFLTESPAMVQEFAALPKEKLAFFVSKEAAARGIKLSEADIKALISSFSGDLWAIGSELDKLSLAKARELPSPSATEPGYFELLNALKFGRNREKKLIALEILLYKLKEDPARVFNGLAYSSPRGISPESWFGTMADYDVAVKSGKMDYEEALLDFVIR